MRKQWNIWLEAVTVAGLLVGMNGGASARGLQHGQGSQSQPPAQQSDKPKTPEVTPLTLDVPAPVNAEEDAAYKAFQAVNPNDAAKKIETGEAFILKYPESRYKSPVYGALTFAYLQAGNTQKMQEYGEKEIALAPNDVSTLALLAQTLPRSLHGSVSTPEAVQVLAKAEQFSKQAIEITPTLPKPENLTDEAFASAKNQTLAMAHSGLGLVYVRRGKNAEAIPELEQAIKVDPNPDPVNYYLLGMANKATSHFDDAVAALNKCVAMGGPLVGTCKAQADDAKKLGATQLSAPK
ncbi:MAG TPA: tetratricopeptide repeat protein [Candidatus Acidoferrum sp.]|nr:tetratricopeptide repeat protein [Candidatus Acidoferrum sp.]